MQTVSKNIILLTFRDVGLYNVRFSVIWYPVYYITSIFSLQGWLPQGVVDQSVSSAQLTSIQKLQAYVSQLGVEGIRQ